MQPTHHVRLMSQARRDLVEIFDRIAPSSLQNAIGVLRTINAATESLTFMPRRFRVYRHNRSAARVVRALTCRPYVIYYRESVRAKRVYVLTVRHGARLPPTRFPTT